MNDIPEGGPNRHDRSRPAENLFDGLRLTARNLVTLVVLIVARISTVHQDRRSLADQIALCEQYVRDRYHGPVEFMHIQGQGSGEVLDRCELAEAEAAIESGRFDLIIVEDIGRICRRHRAFDFCEMAEDAGTRLVALNDAIDTAREDWRLNAVFASFKHESSNQDTSKRIRRSLRHRFEQGGVLQTFPFGYIVPQGATTDAEVFKNPEAEPVMEQIFRMLEEGASYQEVADWLNSHGVKPGRWMRREKWDGRAVARLVHNPVLKGYRRRNERKSKRINRSGKRISVRAPQEERIYRHVPHLAFFSEERYDRLIALLRDQHADCARGRKAGDPDQRAGISRKRTVWPGQHLRCGVCGRLMYWGGHGQNTHMMCAGARDYACWLAATFDGSQAARRLTTAMLAAIEALPGYDDRFLAEARGAAAARRSARSQRLDQLGRELTQKRRELANLIAAFRASGSSPALQAELAATESDVARLAQEEEALLGEPDDLPPLPPIEELKTRAREAVARLDYGDPAFGRVMKTLMPDVIVLPYQCLDGGPVVLRAHATVSLAPLLGPSSPLVAELFDSPLTVDLFDPPQRVAFREQVVRLRLQGETEQAAAAQLGVTVTAAQRAASLNRLMEANGTDDAYRLLTSPPDGEGKCCRHLHTRYVFQPLEGFPRWNNR